MARNLAVVLRSPFTLAMVWIWGLLSGIFAYSASGPILLPMMRRIPFCAVSILCLIAVTVFPFLISALAVSFSGSVMLLPIAFGKAAVLSFVTMGCALSSSGWLVCCLMLLCDWTAVPFLYSFWLLHLSGERIRGREAFLLIAVCLLLVCAEYWIISPLLGRLVVW